ncbi:WD40 repeat-like protein [Thozetella sp. PMI_491]|nr:WD40 repeat-like protein [Thozetella sp. PMI_491]
MATTPSNRLKLTPSNSPFLHRLSRSPIRAHGRPTADSRLSLKRVVGTTCCSPTGFDTVYSSFAYIAGGAVVVVDVQGEHYSQRFYRARPTAVPIFAVLPVTHAPSTPNTTPKANDSRNRVAAGSRDSFYGSLDLSESPSSKTWTSRERIKAATCLALSRDGRYLAVGETGYGPRVLIFSLQDASSDVPLVSISEHTFGVKAVAWSEDTKFLASLGTANDGFLFLWRIDPRTGAAKLFQQNRCTANIKGMFWVGSSLITFGVRHIKVWRAEEEAAVSPTKSTRFAGDGSFPTASAAPKPLSGRNIVLGSMLEAAFSCAVAIDDSRAIICSDAGDVCLLDDTDKQMKFVRVLGLGFHANCVSVRNELVHIGGKDGHFTTLSVKALLKSDPDALVKSARSERDAGLFAMGFLAENLVTIDSKRSIDIWNPEHVPLGEPADKRHVPIPGHGDPIAGIQPLAQPNIHGGAFFTWSGAGKVTIWQVDGMIRSSFDVPIEQVETGNESEPMNQLLVVKASQDGSFFVAGDRLGILRVIDPTTKHCLLETKAHASDCHDVGLYEEKSLLLLASCGRDRTVQLFHKSSTGSFEHFQTLEFAARVVQALIPSADRILTCSLDRTLQIHDVVTKDGEPDAIAAISGKVIPLKASPSSMTVTQDGKCAYLSLLDRSVSHIDLGAGRTVGSFKCTDESGGDPVVLDSLIYSQSFTSDLTFLLAVSNTDKSVRMYDAQSGCFLDREWGHTEAINGAILVGEDNMRKVVSVGCDGTIMIWALDLEPMSGSMSRDPSPEKSSSTSHRPPLRKVLSKAELAEFTRPTSSGGRRSPPRIQRRTSRLNLNTNMRTPQQQTSPTGGKTIAEDDGDRDTPLRRVSSHNRSESPPPVSPKNRMRIFRRPSLPALSTTPTATPPSGSLRVAARKKSSSSLRGGRDYGFGSLSMATEQTCRQLRAYRKKLGGSDPISGDVLAELDAELRLTAAALGERAIRARSRRETERDKDNTVSETVLSGLLDQYSELLVSKLGEKLRLRLSEEDLAGISGLGKAAPAPRNDVLDEKRPKTADGNASSRASSVTLNESREDVA